LRKGSGRTKKKRAEGAVDAREKSTRFNDSIGGGNREAKKKEHALNHRHPF